MLTCQDRRITLQNEVAQSNFIRPVAIFRGMREDVAAHTAQDAQGILARPRIETARFSAEEVMP
jgi:hypothetical protein